MSQEKKHYLGHRERLKERLAKDPRSLADYEFLELLLGLAVLRRDTKPLAKELLDRFKTLRGVVLAPGEELKTIDGFGPGLASLFTLLVEFKARFEESAAQDKPALSHPSVVAEIARARLGHKKTEEFWIALVDNRNRLIGWEKASQGTVDQAAVYPREIMLLALERKAAGVILVHNHPGGDMNPSQADLDLTSRLARVGADLGVRVLDHIIVAETQWYSFRTSGRMPQA